MKIENKKIAAKKSSVKWLTRQLHDPYVERAKKEGWRARAVYKLIEINEKYRFLKNSQTVVDLGAAPGSWAQYIAQNFPRSHVIAMDLLEIKPIPGVDFYTGDFTTDEALNWLGEQIAGKGVDIVLSDMAPNTTGHQKTDHLRQMVLLEYAWDFAIKTLKPGGTFVAKSFTGGTTNELLKEIKKHFDSVHHIKPPSSRSDSVEMFIVATGFKG